jgi:hypothetical protein
MNHLDATRKAPTPQEILNQLFAAESKKCANLREDSLSEFTNEVMPFFNWYKKRYLTDMMGFAATKPKINSAIQEWLIKRLQTLKYKNHRLVRNNHYAKRRISALEKELASLKSSLN